MDLDFEFLGFRLELHAKALGFWIESSAFQSPQGWGFSCFDFAVHVLNLKPALKPKTVTYEDGSY